MFDKHKYDNIYIDYHRIERNLFRERVRFYENHINELSYLNFYQKLEIDIDYCSCLFEIGKYYYFLEKVDPLIEKVIIENIYHINGKDVYNDLLFKKAASLYNNDRFEESRKISSQLVNISSDERSKLLYGKCIRKLNNDQLNWVGAIAIVLLLSGLSLSLTILLVFDPFYPEVAKPLLGVRNFLFVSGVVLILGKELWMIYYISRSIGFDFTQSVIMKGYKRTRNLIINYIETLNKNHNK